MSEETGEIRETGQSGTLSLDQVLDRLARVIQWSNGFTLAPVCCNHPAQRGELARKLRERLPGRRLLEVTLGRPLVSLLDELAGRWDPTSPPDAISVYGLELSIGPDREYSRVFGRLNHDRELLRQAVPAPLLLWLPDFALDYLARGAPDFWAWRSGVYEFPTDTSLWLGEAAMTFSADRAAVDALPLAEKHREIQRLESLLDAARALPRQGRTEQEIIASSLRQLGQLKHSLADYQEAMRLYQESLKIYEELGTSGEADIKDSTPGADYTDLVAVLNDLGLVLRDIGDMIGAIEHFKRALAIDENTYGPDHQEVARDVNNLGIVFRDLGNLVGAREHLERAQAIDEQVYGSNDPHVAARLNNLGVILHALGELAGAKSNYERALVIVEKTYGPDHPMLATAVSNLAGVLQDLGDQAGAREYLEQALVIDENTYGPDHPTVAVRVNNLGDVLRDQGDLAGAREHFERALGIFWEFLGEDHPSTVAARRNLESLPAP